MTNHQEIRDWAEARGGRPACVKGTGGKDDPGMIRLEFPKAPNANDDNLQPISWDDWFQAFDDNKLALLYQDEQNSRFNKLVNR